MLKLQVALFLVFISVNDIAGKCLEESSANEGASEILEKSELFTADPLSSEGKSDEAGANDQESKGGEIEQREDSHNKQLDLVDTRAELNEFIDVIETETSLKEKSGNDEVTNERKAEEVKSNVESKTAEPLEKETERSGKNTEKKLEELPDISKSATEIEEKKAEDLSEASAESKLSDNEMTSLPSHESDRTEAKSGELKEIPHELGLDEIIATRRMLSQPNEVLNIKARTHEGLSMVVPEDKIAQNPTINAYNNFEFGPGNSKLSGPAHVLNQNNKLIPPQTTTDSHISLTSNTPETRRVESQVEHQNVPQFYPQSKLHLDFPVFDVQQQEPRGVPIYLELEHDQEKLKNNINGAQNTQRCNVNCVPRKRQYHQSQNNMDMTRPLIINQLRNVDHEDRSQDQQFHQTRNLNPAAENRNMEKLFHNPRNPQQQFQDQRRIATKPTLENSHFVNLSLESRPQIPLFLQNRRMLPILPVGFKTSLENTHSENLGHASKNQEITLEPKQSENLNHDQRNQLQQFHQVQRMIDPNMSPENKAFENLSHEKYVYPYPNMQLIKNPIPNILKVPVINYDLSSENIKSIFQTLAEATANPKKLANNLQNSEIKQTYPNFFHPNNGGSSPYEFNYLPRFKY